MNASRRLLNPYFIRFALVGGVNTTLDLLLFLVLSAAGAPLVVANFCSTSAGLTFSFVANRSFTFRSQRRSGALRQAVVFVLGTGTGLWAVQPLVIVALVALLRGVGLPAGMNEALAKAGAIGVSMAWNWMLYSRVVFRVAPLPGAQLKPGTAPLPL